MRREEVSEDFGGDPTGSYLKITLKNESPVKAKGWTWVQSALRGLLGKRKGGKGKLSSGWKFTDKNKKSDSDRKASSGYLPAQGGIPGSA